MRPQKDELIKEAIFKTSRSGGKGGQHVNKVSSKVEVVFNVVHSLLFSDEEKLILQARLAHRLDTDGHIHVVAQEDRSQLMNKQRAVLKLYDLLEKSLIVQKKRKPTKVPKAVVQKRLQYKAAHAEKKNNRKTIDW